MSQRYLLIAARRTTAESGGLWADAARLARTGAQVTVIATDDCTVEAVALSAAVQRAIEAGSRILVDGAALRRRNLSTVPAVLSIIDDDEITDRLMDPAAKAVWR